MEIMRAFAFLALAAFVLSFPGCAQGGAAAQNASSGGNGGGTAFALPASEISYHAIYNVEEGGAYRKEVWRAKDKMRSDLSMQGQKALSFFFIGSRAYSCTYIYSSPACYDVTATLSQADADRLVPAEADVAGATQVESVKIGNSTTGKCYELSMGALGARKLCFAPQGVVAYDSYSVSKTITHTEYLTDIEYFGKGEGPEEGVFVLPAAPTTAPETTN